MSSTANRGVPIRSAPDPTESKTVRGRFKRDMNTRHRKIKGDIRATIQDNDAFRLKDRDQGSSMTQEDLPPSLEEYLSGNSDVAPAPVKIYNDITVTDTRPDDLGAVEDSARLDQLDAWLDYVYAQRLVEPMDPEEIRQGDHWTAEYLDQAFVKGDRLAVRDLKQAGFEVPTDDPLELLYDARSSPVLREEYSETVHDLEYLANDMRRDSHRNAAAVLGGAATLALFRDSVAEPLVTDGGQRMAQIVDVRMVETVNRGALERYAATEGVSDLEYLMEAPIGGGDAPDRGDTHGEWTTAGDNRVCAECAERAGEVYSVEDLKNGNVTLPPLHPHCRCVIKYYRERSRN